MFLVSVLLFTALFYNVESNIERWMKGKKGYLPKTRFVVAMDALHTINLPFTLNRGVCSVSGF